MRLKDKRRRISFQINIKDAVIINIYRNLKPLITITKSSFGFITTNNERNYIRYEEVVVRL